MHDFVGNLTIVLGAAAVTTILFQRLRQPIVLGYLLAGLLIGPHVPFPLVADQEMVHTLSETGVILLIFSIGLEFSLRKLLRVGRTAGIVAVLQVALMLWLGYATAKVFGWTSHEAIFTGAIISISSTTIIAKAFDAERVRPKLRELVFAVLIVEDLLGIIIIAILNTVTRGEAVSAGELFGTVARLVGFLAALVAGGMLIIPRAIRMVLRLGRPETTLVAAIAVCFGISMLVRSVGYSVALGAFIAGSLVAESGEAEAVERLVQPVRDLFAAIFFVAVGMMIDPALIVKHWLAIAVLTGVVVVGKLIGVTTGAFLVGSGLRTSIQAGLSLAQIGEFSFIIAALGLSSGATRNFLYPVAVAVSAITTLLTPWMIRGSEPLAAWVDRKMPPPLQTFFAVYGTWIERLGARPAARRSSRTLRWLLVDVALLAALVIGSSMFEQPMTVWLAGKIDLRLARLLPAVLGLVLALPFALGVIRLTRSLAETWAREALPPPDDPTHADLSTAPRRALIAATQIGSVLFVGLALMVITQPFLPLAGGAAALGAALVGLGVAFWRNARNLEGHVRAGAEVIVEALARESKGADHSLEHVDELVPGIGNPVALRIEDHGRAVGKSLAQLNLRGLTGATVLALQRKTESVVSPSPNQTLEANDVVVLIGTREAVDAARTLLNQPA